MTQGSQTTPWDATPVLEHTPHDRWCHRRKIHPTSPGTGRDSKKKKQQQQQQQQQHLQQP